MQFGSTEAASSSCDSEICTCFDAWRIFGGSATHELLFLPIDFGRLGQASRAHRPLQEVCASTSPLRKVCAVSGPYRRCAELTWRRTGTLSKVLNFLSIYLDTALQLPQNVGTPTPSPAPKPNLIGE